VFKIAALANSFSVKEVNAKSVMTIKHHLRLTGMKPNVPNAKGQHAKIKYK